MDGKSQEDKDLAEKVTTMRSQLETLLANADKYDQPMLAIKLDEALQAARLVEAQLKAEK